WSLVLLTSRLRRYIAHLLFSFFFNLTATTEIYTLSLHDALPILPLAQRQRAARTGHARGGRPRAPRRAGRHRARRAARGRRGRLDRKSTRLNSSHVKISYAVF